MKFLFSNWLHWWVGVCWRTCLYD